MNSKGKNSSILIVISILIGILVSLLAVVYAQLITFMENHIYKSFIDSYWIIIIPAIGGLLVGILIKFNALTARGHGIPAILQTIKTKKIHFSFHNLWMEGFASALTIGSGGSAGRIGPLVEIGAGMADLLDKKFNFSQDNYQTLLGCGAAAAISAIFNAPLGGIVFSMEILFRDLELKKITLVIISSLSANIFTQSIFNIKPLFIFPNFIINSSLEYLLFLLLGIIIGIIGFIFVKNLYYISTFFDSSSLPLWLRPTLGGLMVGIIGFFIPEILGSGTEVTNEIFLNENLIIIIIIVIIFKVLMTGITLGSGGSGGVFSPILMVGGLTGLLFAIFINKIFSSIIELYISYGLIGMAAAFGAISQAPFTASLIIFELTGDYTLIVPLLFTSVISSIVYSLFMEESVYSPELFKRF